MKLANRNNGDWFKLCCGIIRGEKWPTLTQTLDCLTADHAFMKGSYCHVVCVIVNWCGAVFDAGSVIFCLGVVAADMTQSLAQPLCAKYLVNDDYQNDRKMIHCWVWKHRRTCKQTEFSACFRFSCRFNLRGVGGWFTEDCSLIITAVNLLQPGSAANIPNAPPLTHSISSSFNLLPLLFFLLLLLLFSIYKKNKQKTIQSLNKSGFSCFPIWVLKDLTVFRLP